MQCETFSAQRGLSTEEISRTSEVLSPAGSPHLKLGQCLLGLLGGGTRAWSRNAGRRGVQATKLTPGRETQADVAYKPPNSRPVEKHSQTPPDKPPNSRPVEKRRTGEAHGARSEPTPGRSVTWGGWPLRSGGGYVVRDVDIRLEVEGGDDRGRLTNVQLRLIDDRCHIGR